MKYILPAILLLAFTALSMTFARMDEHPFLQKLRAQWQAYNARMPQEKIYVSTDKTIYAPGEDIWFNAVLFESEGARPSSISDVVYIELRDPKGGVFAKKERPVIEAGAAGSFALPAHMEGGLYRLRAYTNWMRNFGEEVFFEKELIVQRVVTPRLLMEMDILKESYGPGDEATASLKARTLNNEAAAGAEATARLYLNGAVCKTFDLRLDREGKALIVCRLPDTLNTSDAILQVLVKAGGIEESIMRSVPIALHRITLRFFPEGGEWVEGVDGRIAFKALNEHGKAADVAGEVWEEGGGMVAEFESFHMGMGVFSFTPQKGKKYTARVTRPAGRNQWTPLPEAKTGQYALQLERRSGKKLHWKITSPHDGIGFLVAHAQGKICYAEAIELKTGQLNHMLSTDTFPAGIVVYTLFDASGAPRCERLAFNQADKRLRISIQADKEKYLPRERVRLSIKTADEQGRSVQARLSLSVVDDQLVSFADDKQHNLLSQLWLGSELKGEIQEPSFYFDPEESKAEQALDLLMLTHGWRRFRWPDLEKPLPSIVYQAENARTLTGQLTNAQGRGVGGLVYLMELNGKKRMAKVRTLPDGYFTFNDIDFTTTLVLLTPSPNQIAVAQHQRPEGMSDKARKKDMWSRTLALMHAPIDDQPNNVQRLVQTTINFEGNLLQEVMVVGYATESSRSLAECLITISPPRLETFRASLNAAPTMESVLSGKMAGICITPRSADPGAGTQILIDGRTVSPNSFLYILDDRIVAGSLNEHFPSSNLISATATESIYFSNNFNNIASTGGLGTIQVHTLGKQFGSYYTGRLRKNNYNKIMLEPRFFDKAREFYAPDYSQIKAPEKRTDFRTTVYWNPAVVTDQNGEGTVEFYNNDAVSTFRITAEGFTAAGLAGRNESFIYSQLPLSLDAKIPTWMAATDTLNLPLRIQNNSASALKAYWTVQVSDSLNLHDAVGGMLDVPPLTTMTQYIRLSGKNLPGEYPVQVNIKTDAGYKDAVAQTVKVISMGYPMRLSFNGRTLDTVLNFDIPDIIPGSIHGTFSVHTNLLDGLSKATAAILQAPHGCFEQVSASTFPNILALQFLKATRKVNPEMEKQALTYIQDGYNKLVAYETKQGGFEWWGATPPHEALTAYGLLQFFEMAKVWDGVDARMVERTKKWLLQRKDGRGGFRQNQGKYGFSAAPKEVNNAYIVYALSETGEKEISIEYAAVLREARESGDFYRLALMANAAYQLGYMEDYRELIGIFRQSGRLDQAFVIPAQTSITYSQGQSLYAETLSLWTLALLKDPSNEASLLRQGVDELLRQRTAGMFGSTQATILALKALTSWAPLYDRPYEGSLELWLDNALSDRARYNAQAKDNPTEMTGWTTRLSAGKHQIKVHFSETDNPPAYSMDLSWMGYNPPPNDQCKVSLRVTPAAESVRVNESLRLKVELQNKTGTGLPMTVALIGIPAGFSLQPWQLKELKEKGVFDFYEIVGDRLALYYRELRGSEKHIAHLDLKAEIPGVFTASASSAYLYYTEEYKDWASNYKVRVKQ